MRLPRIRFTIGWLILAVVLAALASWGLFIVRPRIALTTIILDQADVNYKQAKLVREVAEYALKEYKQGLYLQDKAKYDGQVDLTRSDVKRAIDRLSWLDRDAFLQQLRRVDPLRPPGAGLGRKEEAEQARALLELLEQYQRQDQRKMQIELKQDIEKAKADETTKLQTLQIERSRHWRWAILGF
jgi:HlyD family secretion protein